MDQQQKARHARQLLEDEVLVEAMEAATDAFHDEWMAAETIQAREDAWAKTNALSEVLSHLVFLAAQEDEEEDEPTSDIP